MGTRTQPQRGGTQIQNRLDPPIPDVCRDHVHPKIEKLRPMIATTVIGRGYVSCVVVHSFEAEPRTALLFVPPNVRSATTSRRSRRYISSPQRKLWVRDRQSEPSPSGATYYKPRRERVVRVMSPALKAAGFVMFRLARRSWDRGFLMEYNQPLTTAIDPYGSRANMAWSFLPFNRPVLNRLVRDHAGISI